MEGLAMPTMDNELRKRLRTNIRRLRESMGKQRDPDFYKCPREGCPGGVNFVGIEAQKRRIYECDTCRHKLSEEMLEREERKRRSQD
jgi:hypothetical protein